MTARIAVVGSLNMDLIIRTPRIPRPGETIIGGSFHTAAGGKGANQAVAAARLGGQVSLVGRVGSDSFGSALSASLVEAGVDRSFVTVDQDHPTGVAFITVDDSGQNSIVVAAGANMHLSPRDVELAASAIAAADVLMLQLEIPTETVLAAAQIARSHGVTVVLNPAPACPLPLDLLGLVDVLIPNETEAALLAEFPVTDKAGIEAAAAKFIASGVQTVVVTLGSRGAFWVCGGEAAFSPAFVVEAVDTTGAGDAFVAGLAVAIAEGKAIREAVEWGSASGALAATTLGAQTSMPYRAAVEHLLAQGIKRAAVL